MRNTVKGYTENEYPIGWRPSVRPLILIALLIFLLTMAAKDDGITVYEELANIKNEFVACGSSSAICVRCGGNVPEGVEECLKCQYKEAPLVGIYVIGLIGGFLGFLALMAFLMFIGDGYRINRQGNIESVYRPLFMFLFRILIAWAIFGAITIVLMN